MNRKGPWEGNARYLLPVFLFAYIFIERETSGYEAVPRASLLTSGGSLRERVEER